MGVETFFTIVVGVFVVGVLALVAYALFELSPFAPRSETYRDPETGRRRWESPRVD
jgi:hypothetical protein